MRREAWPHVAAHLSNDSLTRRQLDSQLYFCNQSAAIFHVTGLLENSTGSLYENEKGKTRAKVT